MSRHSKKRHASDQEQEQEHGEESNSMKVVCKGKDTEQSQNTQQKPCNNEHASLLHGINHASNITVKGQTSDASVPVDSLFPNGFPEGTFQYYVEDDSRSRETGEEKRLASIDLHEIETSLRKAGEVHKEARSYIQNKIKPEMRFWDLCCDLEDKVRSLIGENGPNAGMGFPTGCSINHVAAHYTPNPHDMRRFHYGDVMKLDFGTEVNGYIIDSAFTFSFDPQFDPLIAATRDATYTAIKAAGVDANLGELGGVIEEVINSYEVTIDGRTYPIVPIRNLAGHNLVKGSIHGDKCVPLVFEDSPERMEAGDIFAIETFATTGTGYADPGGMTSHYALNPAAEYPAMCAEDERLLKHIMRTFNTLPFCRRWLDRPDGGSFAVNGNQGRQVKCIDSLNRLVERGIVEDYPPLCDQIGSYSSQLEHTFLVKEDCKEVFSMGLDY